MIRGIGKRALVLAALCGAAALFIQFSPRAVRAGDPLRLPSAQAAVPVPPLAVRPPVNTADLVVLVSLDGLRADVVRPDLHGLHRLYLQGASPHFAKTIDKSATLPSHASMVSGVELREHGLDFNAFRPENGHIQRPTIFSTAHDAGLPVVMYVGKAKLQHLLASPREAEFKMAGMFCEKLLKTALPALREAERGIFFIHLADPDSAGHRHGWMTEEYFSAVRDADRCLERIIDTIDQSGRADRTLLLVTSDHGGHERSHGTRLDVDQRIPWFAWGAGVRRGHIEHNVHTTDTAATVLTALGLGGVEAMQGKAVDAAIQGALGPTWLPLVGLPLVP